MELKVLECSQYILEEKIKEFSKNHKILKINYLFKQPGKIISIIEYTTTQEYKDKIAKEEKAKELELRRNLIEKW